MAEVELMVRDATQQTRLANEVLNPSWMSHIEEHRSWPTLGKLTVVVSVELAIKRFCVRDVLALQKGQVFESVSPETEDVPLVAGTIQVAWSEFEVVDRRLVARLTRLT